MNTVNLIRFGSIPGMGTFGKFVFDGNPICFTIEREWLNNIHDISCIPIGNYICSLHESPHFGEVYKVVDVPNRSDILIHPANIQSELRGCIAPGMSLGYYQDHWAVMNSRVALEHFMHFLGGEDFTLNIDRM